MFLYANDPYEAKYQLLINKRKSTDIKYLNDSKDFTKYSNDMDDIYKNIEEYNPNKKQKILIAFDDMISYMLSNKKLNPIVTELFIRGRKINSSLIFITQSSFAVLRNIRLNSTQYSYGNFKQKRTFEQIAFNHSSDSDFKDIMNLYKKCTAKPCSFLFSDTTLVSDNSSSFRENFF